MLLIPCILIAILLLFTDIYAEGEPDSGNYDQAMESGEIQYTDSPVNKLGRGVVNTATCWAEIPAEIFAVSKDSDPVLGCTLGLAQGIFAGLLRGLTGIYDTLTFFAPPYDKPLMEPEYALQSVDQKQKEYLW
jgi:putative exosortase-associated protein (TIGR04073 family)